MLAKGENIIFGWYVSLVLNTPRDALSVILDRIERKGFKTNVAALNKQWKSITIHLFSLFTSFV